MGNEELLFSTKVGGYDKAQVIEYIEKIDRSAKKSIVELNEKINKLQEENEQLKNQLENSEGIDIINAKNTAKEIIEAANKKAMEINEKSQADLKNDLAKTKYLYNRREAVKKILAEQKQKLDELYDEIDFEG